MKKAVSWLLVLVMAMGWGAVAMGESGQSVEFEPVEIMYREMDYQISIVDCEFGDAETAHVSIESQKGRHLVRLMMQDDNIGLTPTEDATIGLDGEAFFSAVTVAVEIDGEEVAAEKSEATGKGGVPKATFYFATDAVPDAIILYPEDGDESTKVRVPYGAGDEKEEEKEEEKEVTAQAESVDVSAIQFKINGVAYQIDSLQDEPAYARENKMDGLPGHVVTFAYMGSSKAEEANSTLYSTARLIVPSGEAIRTYANDGNTENPYTLFFGLPDGVLLSDCVLRVQTDDGEMSFPLGEGTKAEAVEAVEETEEPEPTVEPTMEPEVAEEGDALEESTEQALGMEDVGSDAYRQLYEYLKAGNVIKSGSKGDEAKALQQLLVDLGAQIGVDGAAGKKTMAAVNEAREELGGEEPVDEVGVSEFQGLMKYKMAAVRPDVVEDWYKDITETHGEYLKALVQKRMGNNYTAEKLFGELGDYLDSAEKAKECVLKWPSNGQVYRNGDYGAESAKLKIKATRESGMATYVKIYTTDGVLVSGVFIKESGSATVRLPAKRYIMKCGVGTDWYGVNEAFGDGAETYYNELVFDGEDDNSVLLAKGGDYVLTLQATGDEGGDDVGSTYESWGNF